jgi:AcrR family transcriptional regulator
MASAKRDHLVQTAERLFYANGFHATGIDTIVRAAGVVRMTLYNQFGSKDALVQAVLTERHDRFLARIDAAVAQAEPGAATLALVDAHNAWLADHGDRGCILVRAMGEYAEHNAAIHGQAAANKRIFRERIADALARDGLPAALTDEIFLLLEGANNAVPTLGADGVRETVHRSVANRLAQATEATP